MNWRSELAPFSVPMGIFYEHTRAAGVQGYKKNHAIARMLIYVQITYWQIQWLLCGKIVLPLKICWIVATEDNHNLKDSSSCEEIEEVDFSRIDWGMSTNYNEDSAVDDLSYQADKFFDEQLDSWLENKNENDAGYFKALVNNK